MNLYEISIPILARLLGQVPVWLDKLQAHAELKKYDPQVVLTARLAPDQWHFTRHVQVVALGTLRLAAALRGQEAPAMFDFEPTIPAIREHIAAVLAQLQALKAEDFRGAEDLVIPMPFAPSKAMHAPAFVSEFALPNFYFHGATAYAILRHNGVDVGKMDFLGPISIRDL